MSKQVINSDKAPSPIGPYNQAILVDSTLYVSGQIAIDQSTGELLTDDLKKETHMVMKNLGFVLEAAGMTYANIIKTSIFISDMNSFATINEVYGSYFEGEYPARETVEVANLPKFVNVEISCIAIKESII